MFEGLRGALPGVALLGAASAATTWSRAAGRSRDREVRLRGQDLARDYGQPFWNLLLPVAIARRKLVLAFWLVSYMPLAHGGCAAPAFARLRYAQHFIFTPSTHLCTRQSGACSVHQLLTPQRGICCSAAATRDTQLPEQRNTHRWRRRSAPSRRRPPTSGGPPPPTPRRAARRRPARCGSDRDAAAITELLQTKPDINARDEHARSQPCIWRPGRGKSPAMSACPTEEGVKSTAHEMTGLHFAAKTGLCGCFARARAGRRLRPRPSPLTVTTAVAHSRARDALHGANRGPRRVQARGTAHPSSCRGLPSYERAAAAPRR